jgi:hypothetical protein
MATGFDAFESDPDGPLDPTNWLTPHALNTVDMVQLSGKASPISVTTSIATARWIKDPFDYAQESWGMVRASLAPYAGGLYGLWLCLHMIPDEDTYYGLVVSADPARELQIVQRVAGVSTVLASDTEGETPAVDSECYFSIDYEGTLVAKLNTIERVSIADVTLYGGNPGIACIPGPFPGGDTAQGWGEWRGGDLVPEGVVEPGPSHNVQRSSRVISAG